MNHDVLEVRELVLRIIGRRICPRTNDWLHRNLNYFEI